MGKKDERYELIGYSLLEHYEKHGLVFLKKQIEAGMAPKFKALTNESRQLVQQYKQEGKIIEDLNLEKEEINLNADHFHALVAFSFNSTSRYMSDNRLTKCGLSYLGCVQEAMFMYQDFCLSLWRNLRKLKKIFDPSKFYENTNLGVNDLVRFHLLTTRSSGMLDNDLAIEINKQYDHLKISPLKTKRVSNIRYALFQERAEWISLRNELAKDNYCRPVPIDLSKD